MCRCLCYPGLGLSCGKVELPGDGFVEVCRLWFRCTIVDRVSAGSVEEQSANVEDALEQSWLQNIAAPPYAVLQISRFSNNNGRTACLTATVTTPTFSFSRPLRPRPFRPILHPVAVCCDRHHRRGGRSAQDWCQWLATLLAISDVRIGNSLPSLLGHHGCTSQQFMVEKRMYRLKEKMHGRNLSYFVTLSWWL